MGRPGAAARGRVGCAHHRKQAEKGTTAEGPGPVGMLREQQAQAQWDAIAASVRAVGLRAAGKVKEAEAAEQESDAARDEARRVQGIIDKLDRG